MNKIKLLNFFCSSTSRIPHLEVTAQDETSLCVFYFTTIEVREASFVKCYGRCYIKLRPGAGNLSIPPGINFRGSAHPRLNLNPQPQRSLIVARTNCHLVEVLLLAHLSPASPALSHLVNAVLGLTMVRQTCYEVLLLTSAAARE